MPLSESLALSGRPQEAETLTLNSRPSGGVRLYFSLCRMVAVRHTRQASPRQPQKTHPRVKNRRQSPAISSPCTAARSHRGIFLTGGPMGASFPGRSNVDLLVRILCFQESSLRVPAHEGEMPRMPVWFWPQSETTCVSIKRGRSIQAVGQPGVGERTQLGPGRRDHLCRVCQTLLCVFKSF